VPAGSALRTFPVPVRAVAQGAPKLCFRNSAECLNEHTTAWSRGIVVPGSRTGGGGDRWFRAAAIATGAAAGVAAVILVVVAMPRLPPASAFMRAAYGAGLVDGIRGEGVKPEEHGYTVDGGRRT
jgi:hypothetical protein